MGGPDIGYPADYWMYIGPDETKLGQEDFFKIDGKTAKSHDSALDQLQIAMSIFFFRGATFDPGAVLERHPEGPGAAQSFKI